MKIDIKHSCEDFDSYRANRVKSLFNATNGHTWEHTAELPIEDFDWGVGLIIGPSGSGKTSLGKAIWGGERLTDLSSGWDSDKPIVDCIAPEGDFNSVTAALSAVGLGDVPAWLRPFHALSNGEKFRAGLARIMAEQPDRVIIDEFTSVVDRQIAKVGAAAFSKAWKRTGKQAILLSCHYDIAEWVEPDWIYDTSTARFTRDRLRRPPITLEIYRTSGTHWKFFKPHYYLDLPHPVAAQYFIGVVNGEAVCHLAVAPMFQSGYYRATRLVTLPEWQGVGVGSAFLNAVCQLHLDGYGRCERKYPTIFHTSHPQLCGYLRRSMRWKQTSAMLYGGNKAKSRATMLKSTGRSGGMGGHFRAVQGFKYVGGCEYGN